MKDVLLILTGYVLGSLPWGYWLPRMLRGVDIRTVGSRSTGAANVWRTLGFKIGLGVAVLDIGKGFAAALLGIAILVIAGLLLTRHPSSAGAANVGNARPTDHRGGVDPSRRRRSSA